VFADQHGHCLYLNERDCSIQRRHQKVVEEAPAPGLSGEQRKAMGEAAVRAAQAIGYVGAGTVEFLLDARGEFFFMEMNTRLQVEHPVTEAITGLDLVAWQIRVAQGEALPITQEQVPLTGHAIEVRLYAEDPTNDFLPATGRLALYRESAPGPGRRVDSGVEQGDSVSPFYDPMLGKLIAWGEDREQAQLRLLAMLDEFAIGGLKTNLGFLRRIIGHPAFAAAELDTGFIPRYQEELLPAPGDLSDEFWQAAGSAFIQSLPPEDGPWGDKRGFRAGLPAEVSLHLSCTGQDRLVTLAADAPPLRGEQLLIERQGVRRSHLAVRSEGSVFLRWDGEMHGVTLFDPIAAVEANQSHQGGLTAPMNGSIVRVLVEVGQHVDAGTQLVVLEAMKMEHSIRAPQAGVVKANMEDRKVTQGELAERLGMSQGGVGHWLNKRRAPNLTDMNRVLTALGLGYLEVALDIRERAEEALPEKNYNPYFRYPVSDWKGLCEVREERATYGAARFELSDYHAQGDAFWLPVTGDAMTAPSGLSVSAGMMILVDPAIKAEPGKLVVAQGAANPQATFRQLLEESGQLYLVPLNPTYPKQPFTDDCHILGVVVQAMAKF
jgi:SOS-response transcriptional repressor LexA